MKDHPANRITILGVSLIVALGVYESVPLALTEAASMPSITQPDSGPRVESIRLLPNPFLSTG